MDISKKDITDYAKTQSNAHHQFLNMMCISEELVRIDCDNCCFSIKDECQRVVGCRYDD